MLSCRESARLIAVSYERRLGLWERLQLGLHLRACALCRRYRQQMKLVDSALSKVKELIVPREEALSREARQRIRESLEREERN